MKIDKALRTRDCGIICFAFCGLVLFSGTLLSEVNQPDDSILGQKLRGTEDTGWKEQDLLGGESKSNLRRPHYQRSPASEKNAELPKMDAQKEPEPEVSAPTPVVETSAPMAPGLAPASTAKDVSLDTTEQVGRLNLSAWTLEDALTFAENENPEIKQAQTDIREAGHNRDRLWSGYIPQLEMQSSLSQDGSVLSLVVSQALYDGGRTRSLLKQNEYRQENLSDRLLVTRQRVRLQVVRDYYRTLLAEERLSYQKGFLSAISNFVDYSRTVYQNRTLSKNDYLRVKLEQRSAIESVKVAEQNLLAEKALLMNTLGHPPGMPLELAEDLKTKELNLDDEKRVEEEILLKSVDVQSLKSEQKELEMEESVQVAPYWPQFSLRASYNTEVGNPENSFLRDDGYEAAVRLTIPIFNGFVTKHIKRQFTERRARLIIAEKKVERELRNLVRVSLNNLKYLESRISSLEESVGEAQQIWKQLNSEYRFQEASILRWIDSLRELTRLEMDKMEATQAFLIEQYRLKELRNGLK